MNPNPSPLPLSDRDHLGQAAMHAYVDDELSPQARQTVQDHLARCGPCAQRVQRMQAAVNRLESLSDTPLGVDLSPRILQQLRSEGNPDTILPWIALVQTAAAAIILAILLPGFQDTVGNWIGQLSMLQIRFFDLAAGIQNNTQIILDILQHSLPSFSEFPAPRIQLIPVWTFFVLAAVIGVIGNTLLFKKDQNL